MDTLTFLNVTALTTIMLSMGLQVTLRAVVDSARPAGVVSFGLVANYVLVPAVTVALLALVQPDPMVSVGFFILAVCPGAPVGPPLTGIAKGNVALSISLMVILAGLSAILAPALLSMASARIAPDR